MNLISIINILICFYTLKGNTLIVQSPEFKVKQTDKHIVLSFEGGTHTFSMPGEPDIPWKIIKIPLAPDETAEAKIDILKFREIESTKPVVPFPHFSGDGLTTHYKIEQTRYGSFPAQNVKNLGTGTVRGRKCLIIAYTPFFIRNGKTYVIEKANINIIKKKHRTNRTYRRINDYKVFDKLLEGKTSPYIPVLNSNLDFFERAFWIKIILSDEGLYRITYQDIKNLGIEPSLYSINEFGLFSLSGDRLSTSRDSIDDLNPLPHSISFLFKDTDNDGYFTENDTLMFYSPGYSKREWNGSTFSYSENPFSNQVVYWLALDKGGGIFMDTISVYPSVWDKQRDYSISYYRYEKNLINLGKRGFRWEGEDLSRRSANPESRVFGFNLDHVKDPDGTMRSYFVILDSSANPDPVHVNYEFNGDTIYSAIYSQTNQNTLRYFTATLQNITLSNIFKIILGTPGDTADYLYLDYFEVEYKRLLHVDDEIHIYDTTSGRVLYKIFTDQRGHLLNVSDYKNPVFLIDWTYENDTLKFVVENTEPVQFYFTKNLKKPAGIALVPSLTTLRDTLNQADYIIVTHKDLVSSITGYLNYRRNNLYIGDSLIQNPRIKIVTTDKIFDQFGFGSPDFVSIRNFLAYTFLFWETPKPLYIMLLGDGSYDYKNYSGSAINYVPTTQWGEVFDPDAGGAFTYDIFYVQFDPPSSDPPDMIIGRIPAKSGAEALGYIEKVKEYEKQEINSTWRNRVLGVADDNRPESSLIFTDEVMNFMKDLPENMDFQAIYTAFYPYDNPSNTRPLSKKEFYEQIKKGYLIVFVWGHGNPYQIFHEKIVLMPGDLSLVNIDFKRPLFFFGACKPSSFDRLEISVGEGFMIGPKTGIATLGPSSLIGYGNYNSVLRAIMNILYDYKNHTLGEIYIEAGVPDKYILLGDPALIFALPEPSIDLTYQSQFVDTLMKGGYGEFIDTINGEGRIKLEFFGQPREKLDTTEASPNRPPEPHVIYIRPDNMFKGYFSLSNSVYHPLFPVPRFLKPGDTLGKIIVYYPGKGKGVVGYVDSIYLKEFDGSVVDTTPPDINLFYRGEELKDSVTLAKGSEIEIVMEDENGILIYGNERIRLEIAGNVYDLTDSYIADENNPNRGRVKWTIPGGISSGYNNMTVTCYDNFGNSATETKIINIAEEIKGVIRCLPYPNPSKGKIYFGIDVTIPGKVDLNIYTLRGRLIYEKKEIYLEDGFNKILWNGKDRDGNYAGNGIYLYRIKFESFDESFKKTIKGKIAILK